MKKYRIEFQLITEYKTFFGKEMIVDQEEFDRLKETSKSFYKYSSFELVLDDGSFMVFPPEILKKSMLRLYTKEEIDENEE